MSTTLLFLLPVGILTIVWSLCFVGCGYPSFEFSKPYSNGVLADANLVAYWPLNDAPGSAPPPPFPAPPLNSTSVGTAADLSGKGHPGSYLIPPNYAPMSTISDIAKPAPGSGLVLLQPSIVPGDISKAGGADIDQNLNPASVDFEGGYVSIPWPPNSPRFTDFTVEAWIFPKWTVGGFTWVLFAAQTASRGFAVYINTDNEWEFTVGNGTTLVPVKTGVPAMLTGSVPDGPGMYVAVTYSSTSNELSLWINPQTASDVSNPPPPMATWTNPDKNFVYAAIDTTQPATFFIGAGAPQLPPRTANGDANGAPLAPFQGWIQSVALYDKALSADDLNTHFENGTLTT